LNTAISPSRVFLFFCLAYLASLFILSLFSGKPFDFAQDEDFPNALSLQYGESLSFEGRVGKDPDAREKNVQLVVWPYAARKEAILVTTERFSEYRYGDVLRISGKLEKPPVFEDFNYQGYLAAKGIYALMNYPEIETVGRKEYHGILSIAYSKILDAKHKLREVLFLHLSPPESIILGALVLGDQSRLTQDMKDLLNRTGLRHIIAISGQHVVILTVMLMSLLLGVGLWRKQAILFAAILMVLFIILSGAEASAVRAGVMGSILFLGRYVGRVQDSFRLLVFAATLMLMQNPLLLFYDVGFQLSCLAVLGIIISFGFFKKVLEKVPTAFGIRDILAMNFSAQAFTLPILIYNFGYVSLAGVLTNILVLPVVPLLIGLGLVFLIGGAVFSPLGIILSFPTFFLLAYFNFIMEFFGKFPFASQSLENLSPVWLLFVYVPLFFLLRKFKSEQDFLS
jgi:competence protein ComEC